MKTAVLNVVRLAIGCGLFCACVTLAGEPTRRPEAQAEERARAAAAKELGLTAAQVQAVKAYFAADVDAVFPAMNEQQRKFLKVQQALVRALAKQELKAVR